MAAAKALAAVLAVVLAWPAPLSAAITTPKTAGGISISPAVQTLSLGSGLLAANAPVSVTNNSGADLTATVRAVDFNGNKGLSGANFGSPAPSDSPYGLAKWVETGAARPVSLPNNKVTSLPVQVLNRADLAPGAHYTAVVVTVEPANGGGAKQLNFRQELAAVILVNKLDGANFGLQLNDLKRGPGGGPIPDTITAEFKSTGNSYVVPRGHVDVTDDKGTLVAKGIINQESTPLLPGQTHTFTVALSRTGQKPAGDRFKLTAYYRYEGQASYNERTLYFKNSPPLLMWLLITSLIIPPSIFVYRKYNKRRRQAGA